MAFSPYGPLDASRLKLSDKGDWDPIDYLPDSLAFPFFSPDCLLLHGAPCPADCAPDVSKERVASVAALARLWDRLGLLHLEGSGLGEGEGLQYVRIFNARKNSTTDRQIGDRRGRNYSEFPVHAAAAGLPTGPMLLGLHVVPAEQQWAAISVTDRRDFYHQFWCSRPKARANTLPAGRARDATRHRCTEGIPRNLGALCRRSPCWTPSTTSNPGFPSFSGFYML